MMITTLATPAVRIASESMGRRATRARIRSPIGNPRAPISRAAISLLTRRRGPDTAVIPLAQYVLRLHAKTTLPKSWLTIMQRRITRGVTLIDLGKSAFSQAI
jgi:hypothetical protein